MNSTVDNKAKCPNCGRESDNYDQLTGMFLCGKCGGLFEMELKKKRRKMFGKEEDSDNDGIVEEDLIVKDLDDNDEKYNEIEAEDLSIFSCIIIIITMFIPIINMITCYIVGNSFVKNEYKKFVMSGMIVSLGLCLAAILMFGYKGRILGDQQLQNRINSYADSIATGWAAGRLDKLEFVRAGISEKNPLDDIAPIVPIVDNESVVEWIDIDDIQYLPGSIQTGEVIKAVLESYDELEIAILIQTKDMLERYEDDRFRNVGALLKGSEKNSNGNYFIKDLVYNEFLIDDYDDKVLVSKDDLYNSRFIFCIKDNKQYSFDIIRAVDDTILGFKIQEVEVE